MAFDDPENPKIIEDFIRAIGAEPVIYSQRNECCGAYMALEDNADYARSRVNAVLDVCGRTRARKRWLPPVRCACTTWQNNARRYEAAREVLHRAAGRGARA